jgi:hypothetical protein
MEQESPPPWQTYIPGERGEKGPPICPECTFYSLRDEEEICRSCVESLQDAAEWFDERADDDERHPVPAYRE